MIEVEKNFDLKPGDRERLIAGAAFLKKKTFTDVYYDRDDYFLTGRDYWLRSRDGRFELKVPLKGVDVGNHETDQYHELETDAEIVVTLQLPAAKNLADALAEAGYKPFATIVTKRETFEKDDFHLDFDEMDFGFTTFEAELMVNDEHDVPAAEARILTFAKEHGIAVTHSPGKVIEYLMRHNPKHYAHLVAQGVIWGNQ